jgi:hypothetical protein
MRIVADSSPLVALIGLGQIDILPALFGQVMIPSAVAIELRDAKRSAAVREFLASDPTWLLERTPLARSRSSRCILARLLQSASLGAAGGFDSDR